MADAHGGVRKNAGRKAAPGKKLGRPFKPTTKEEINQNFDEKALAKLPQLFDTVFQIAQGIKIATYTKPKRERSEERVDDQDQPVYVYSVPPDKAAVFYLVDRAAGKASVKPSEATETELILEIGSLNLEATQSPSERALVVTPSLGSNSDLDELTEALSALREDSDVEDLDE